MIIFLYGKDDYRREMKRRFYAAEFEKKYGAKAEPIDLEEEEGAARLEIASRERTLFSGKHLILLRNAFELEPKKLLPLIQPFLESKEQHLVFSETKKPVKALALLLAAPVKTEMFEVPEGAAWRRFVGEEVKRRGITIGTEALTTLAAAYEGDTWKVATELDKLAHLGRAVTEEDVFALGLDPQGDAFAMIQGLRGPQASSRLASLAALEAKHEAPAKIFNILAALRPREAPLFAAYDEAIKFGRMDFEEALADLVLSP